MAGRILTNSSTIICPHGGQATLFTSNTRTSATAHVLLETDVHPIAGCVFQVSGKPSPCIRVEWNGGAGSVKVSGTPVLVESSMGLCYNGENAPQGPATVVNTQLKVSAQ